MASYNLTHKAIQDLSEIWDYTFHAWSEKQADRYYTNIIENCAEIAKNPSAGKKYFEIHPELYGYIIHKHIIFYRVDSNDGIEITRILHERMDLKGKLNNDPII